MLRRIQSDLSVVGSIGSLTRIRSRARSARPPLHGSVAQPFLGRRLIALSPPKTFHSASGGRLNQEEGWVRWHTRCGGRLPGRPESVLLAAYPCVAGDATRAKLRPAMLLCVWDVLTADNKSMQYPSYWVFTCNVAPSGTAAALHVAWTEDEATREGGERAPSRPVRYFLAVRLVSESCVQAPPALSNCTRDGR